MLLLQKLFNNDFELAVIMNDEWRVFKLEADNALASEFSDEVYSFQHGIC